VPWYQQEPFKTLLPVVVGALIGLLGSIGAVWLKPFLDRREMTRTLKVAFYGEVSALRSALRSDAVGFQELHSIFLALQTLPNYEVPPYPRAIFDVYRDRLGLLRDHALVQQNAFLYSMLGRIEHACRRLTADPHPNEVRMLVDQQRLQVYGRLLLAGFETSILLSMRLGAETQSLINEKLKITIKEIDVTDRDLLQSLREKVGPDPTTTP
jgi:hypothetical protein